MRKFVILATLLLPGYLLAQPITGPELAKAAIGLTEQHVVYDPGYYSIPYPNGDVPEGRGVCTDVVIRAYRKLGVDLQQKVHEDMKANFSVYPDRWGSTRPDPNIDHRRVPNLMKYFSRWGQELSVAANLKLYAPGDVVCWDLGNGILHIGILSAERNRAGRLMVVHNIGSGQVMEDVLLHWPIIGHYRYGGKRKPRTTE